MSEASLNKLLETLRSSGFAQAEVRSPGLDFAFSRQQAESGMAGSSAADLSTAFLVGPTKERVVRKIGAPATGIVSLEVKAASPVDDGSQLGHVQMHRKRVPVVATTSGVIHEIYVADGTFVAYGDELCLISDQAES